MGPLRRRHGTSLRRSSEGCYNTGVTPPRGTIHFGCSNCTTALVARRNQAGKRLRCPLCNTAIVVPRESRSQTPAEAYAVANESGGTAPPAAEQGFYVNCPVCRTRIHATRKQAGQTIVCPDCGTKVTIPAASQQQALPAASARKAGPPPRRSKSTRSPQAKASRRRRTRRSTGDTFPWCASCATLGCWPRKIRWGRRWFVPIAARPISYRRRPRLRTSRRWNRRRGYALAGTSFPPPLPGSGGSPDTASKSPANAKLYLYKCPVCHTRLHATKDEAGKTTALSRLLHEIHDPVAGVPTNR